MISTNFKQVLRECARSQSINPDGGSFTQEYADQLAEAITNRVGLLWTQEFWPFLMKHEQRTLRPVWDDEEIIEEGFERFHGGAYYLALLDHVNVEPGTDETYWKEVLSVTDNDVAGYVWDPYLAWDQAEVFDARVAGIIVVSGLEQDGSGTYTFDSFVNDRPKFIKGAAYISYDLTLGWQIVFDDGAGWQYTDVVPGGDYPPTTIGIATLTYASWTDSYSVIPENGIELDEFMFQSNPRIERWARPVRDLAEDELGIHITALRYPAEPWIRFRPQAPSFTAELHSLTISYATGYVVFSAATGECYKSLVDANLGNAVTDTAKWEKQLFPSVFLPAVKMYARAEHLHSEENFEAGFAMEGRAAQLVEKLVDDFFESGARTRRARVVNR